MARLFRQFSTGTPSLYRGRGVPVSVSKTMDDVLNMDAVTSMDTLDESGAPRTMDGVISIDRVIDMNTLVEN